MAPPSETPRARDRPFTSSELDRALDLLDIAIGKSDLLAALVPIRFVCFGGVLAVKVFRNRDDTEDIDVLLDPSVEDKQMYNDELRRVISTVAIADRYQQDWFSDACRLFIAHEKRPALFAKSVAQNIVVYRGRNLVLYAASLEIALERKLRRLDSNQTDRDRSLDISDAVAMVHAMKDEHPIAQSYLLALDMNDFRESVKQSSIDLIAEEYLRKHQQQGVVDMMWDEERQCHTYKNPGGESVFVLPKENGYYEYETQPNS
ncbi:hypothetical protein F5Y07DRAFT_393142 [Xylaria sp. FL0933]|nr:hypothetical protein F5Y07DRAFT_393142 [Xylaria sp. FL0933]